MIGKSAFAAAVAGLIFGLAAPACADDYPSRPIDFIVPLAPGGSTDVLGRIIAQAVSRKRLVGAGYFAGCLATRP